MLFRKKLKSYEFRVFQTPDIAAMEMAKDMLERSEKAMREKNRCVWALSGGSSILKFYDALNDLPDPGADFWRRLMVCWVDERNVPYDHHESNFGTAHRHFWCKIEGPKLLPVPYHSDLGLSVKKYQKKLSDHGIDHEREIEILVLGMGSDGHTASIFPHTITEEIRNVDSGICSIEYQDKRRITMNYSMLNRSLDIKVLAFGPEKGAAFQRALNEKNDELYPILGIRNNYNSFYVDHAFFKEADSG